MFSKCKITVVKRNYFEDVANDFLKNPEKMKICHLVKEGDEFIVDNPYDVPEEMCASAWADIRTYIISIASGGKFKMMKNSDSAIAICSDPIRPVVFKIERI